MDSLNEYVELISPKNMKLQGNIKDGYYVNIVDEELDPFRVDFNYDGCATIKTDGYTEILLTPWHLRKLADLIEKAESKYEKDFSLNK